MNPTNPNSNRTRPAAPNQPRPDLPHIGRFQVLAELGRGGMGAVYRARDPELNREVAIKVLPAEFAKDPVAKARFLREARAQAAVENEHVVPIYDAKEEAGVAYIVMPLLKGMPLSAALKQNPRPPLAELVRIGREIAEGLAAAHAAGLVHRDIKPGNVWLEAPKRRVKILDFGIARATVAAPGARGDADPLTKRNELLGTPQYMSPEQALSKPVDFRSDLFSLGVVLYQMATGERPFNGDGEFQVMAAVVNEHPASAAEVVPGFPPALADLIDRLLAKDPAARPASAQAVAEELEQVLTGISMRAVVVLPLPDAASDAPNPWAELDTTQGREREPETRRGDATQSVRRAPDPEEYDTGDDTEDEPRTYRAARAGGAPKWLLPAAGAGLLAAGLLFAAVLGGFGRKPDHKGESPVVKSTGSGPNGSKKSDGQGSGAKKDDKLKAKEQPKHGADRDAAAWVQSVGGSLLLRHDGQELYRMPDDALPDGPVELLQVSFHLNHRITALGLKQLNGCERLTHVDMTGSSVGNDSLAVLADLPSLTVLTMARTGVSSAGLSALDKCRELARLDLRGTRVGDPVFGACERLPKLTELDLRDTAVTVEAATAFASARPGCLVLTGRTGDAPPKGTATGLYFDGAATATIPKWSFDGKLPLTVEAWVTPASFGKDGSDRHLLLFGTDPAGSGGIGFTPVDGLGVGVRLKDRDFAKNFTSVRFKAGERVHVAVVVSQKRIELFANGKEVGWKNVDLPAQLAAIDGPAVLGKSRHSGGLSFHGTLHGLRVSRAVRYAQGTDYTPAEVLEKDADTLLLYKFDEGSGDVLRDHSGNKRDGTIVGGKWVTK